jgi:hypothetical protein
MKAKIERDDSQRSLSDERRQAPYERHHPSYNVYYDHKDSYAPYHHERRGPAKKTFDSDFDQEAKAYGK